MRAGIPKRQKTEVKTYSRTVVNTVILVVILSLFLYVAIQISRGFSSQVSTVRTQKITDVTYSFLEGVIFTDGEMLREDGEIVHYLAKNGEKIGVGQAYAEIYSSSSLSKDELQTAEKRLNMLSDRIDMLEHGLETGKTASDLGAVSDKISGSYHAYIDAVLGGELAAADNIGETLLSGLVDYSAITLSETAKNTLSELIAERNELISKIGGVKRTLVSDRSFTFYREADGYESVFNCSRLDGMSREMLDGIMRENAEASSSAIGCKVYSSKWYLVLPTDGFVYASFYESVGSSFEVEFLGYDQDSINMTLEAAVADDEDTERSYLLLSSYDLSRIRGFGREQSVRITLSSVTGYRVPADALHTVGADVGVYILFGNRIEFRRVTLIGSGDGYYIVNTFENDRDEGILSDIPYLGVNELIITSGRDLYDGKLLD